MKQFRENTDSFTVIQAKTGKPFSFSLVYISLVGSVTIAIGQIEWSQSTNFNGVQDGARFKPSCVQNLKFQNVPYLEFFH